MGTLATMLLLSIVSADNAEFIERSNQQLSEGYKWNYVGKQLPDGNPAITIKPQDNNEYILFKLQK
jgi:hypothetical protein